MTYILSGNSKLHDLDNLKERCNTDSIDKSEAERFDSIGDAKTFSEENMIDVDFCEHCMPEIGTWDDLLV